MEENSYICIHCGTFLPQLYEQYGGEHIRLSQCQHCNRVADKYIEYDNVLLFIDLILIKPCAYRHTIYNVFLASSAREKEQEKAKLHLEMRSNFNSKVIGRSKASKLSSLSESMDNIISSTGSSSIKTNSSLIPLVFRLGILMLLFEVYVTWAYQEKSFIEKVNHTSLIISLVLQGPIQYIYFLSTTLLQNALLCLSLSYYGLLWLPFPKSTESNYSTCTDSMIVSHSSPVSSPVSSRSPSPTPNLNRSNLLQLRVPNLNNGEKLMMSYKYKTLSSLDLLVLQNREPNLLSKKPSFRQILEIMVTTVLISNIIKLFPIVMLIWPYDPPILHATRLLVRIVHIFLLIEAVYIVLIDPKNNMKKSNLKLGLSPNLKTTKKNTIDNFSNTNANTTTNTNKNKNTTINTNMNVNVNVNLNLNTSSSDYYKVTAVVLISELTRIVVSHIIIAFVASAVWGISVKEIGLDDWKMLKVGIGMLEELGEYILGEV